MQSVISTSLGTNRHKSHLCIMCSALCAIASYLSDLIKPNTGFLSVPRVKKKWAGWRKIFLSCPQSNSVKVFKSKSKPQFSVSDILFDCFRTFTCHHSLARGSVSVSLNLFNLAHTAGFMLSWQQDYCKPSENYCIFLTLCWFFPHVHKHQSCAPILVPVCRWHR